MLDQIARHTEDLLAQYQTTVRPSNSFTVSSANINLQKKLPVIGIQRSYGALNLKLQGRAEWIALDADTSLNEVAEMPKKNFDKGTIQKNPQKDMDKITLTAKLLDTSAKGNLPRIALKLDDLLKKIDSHFFPPT